MFNTGKRSAVVIFGTPSRVYADIRIQRDGGQLDDDWEMHLLYDRDDAERGASGERRGGMRAVLTGALLCCDHSLRYAVHGTGGSWIKRGVDGQEPFVKDNPLLLPPYKPKPTCDQSADADAHDDHDDEHDNAAARAAWHNGHVDWGVDPPSLWGTLKHAVSGTTTMTPSARGSYHRVYDALHRAIVHGEPPYVSQEQAYAVIRIIELALQSNACGRALTFPDGL